HRFGRSSKHLLVELRPATVADRPEWIDAEDTVEAVRHRFGNVESEVAAPRVTDHVRLFPAERVEDAPGVVDVGRYVVRPFEGWWRLAALLGPGDVVF